MRKKANCGAGYDFMNDNSSRGASYRTYPGAFFRDDRFFFEREHDARDGLGYAQAARDHATITEAISQRWFPSAAIEDRRKRERHRIGHEHRVIAVEFGE